MEKHFVRNTLSSFLLCGSLVACDFQGDEPNCLSDTVFSEAYTNYAGQINPRAVVLSNYPADAQHLVIGRSADNVNWEVSQNLKSDKATVVALGEGATYLSVQFEAEGGSSLCNNLPDFQFPDSRTFPSEMSNTRVAKFS